MESNSLGTFLSAGKYIHTGMSNVNRYLQSKGPISRHSSPPSPQPSAEIAKDRTMETGDTEQQVATEGSVNSSGFIRALA